MTSVKLFVQCALFMIIANAASDLYHTVNNLHHNPEQFGMLRYSDKWTLWHSWEYHRSNFNYSCNFNSCNGALNQMSFQNGHGKGQLKQIDRTYTQNKGMQLTLYLWMTSRKDVVKVEFDKIEYQYLYNEWCGRVRINISYQNIVTTQTHSSTSNVDYIINQTDIKISFLTGEQLLLKMDPGELGVYPLVVYALIPMLSFLYAQLYLSSIVRYRSFFLSKVIVARALKIFIMLMVNAFDSPTFLGYMQITAMLINGMTIGLFLQPFRNNNARNNDQSWSDLYLFSVVWYLEINLGSLLDYYEIYLVASSLAIMPNLYRRYIRKVANIGFSEKFLLWYYLYYTVILMDIGLYRNSFLPSPGLLRATAIVLIIVVQMLLLFYSQNVTALTKKVIKTLRRKNKASLVNHYHSVEQIKV